MFILAFDTSSFAGSVAILDAGQVVAERRSIAARRSAQTLAPAMAELLAAAGIKPADMRLVATTLGPGSFTGLRVAATAAKTFAYAAKCDVIGLNTLDVIAEQARGQRTEYRGQEAEIHAVIDAQRKELFLARYRLGPDGPERLARRYDHRRAEAGSNRSPLALWSPVPGSPSSNPACHLTHLLIPQQLREPQSATVGQLAWLEYGLGRRDDLWKLAPAYLRPSYAEEKAKQ